MKNKTKAIKTALALALAAGVVGLLCWFGTAYVKNWVAPMPLIATLLTLGFAGFAAAALWAGSPKPTARKLVLGTLGAVAWFAASLFGLEHIFANGLNGTSRHHSALLAVYIAVGLLIFGLGLYSLGLAPKLLRRITAIAGGTAGLCVLVALGFVVAQYVPLAPFVPTAVPTPTKSKKTSIQGLRIVLAKNASPTEQTAAQLLANTLHTITDETFAIVPTEVFLPAGVPSLQLQSDASLGDEGYRISAKNGAITIAGGKRGVLYGAYHFLEKYLDCRWYTKDLTLLPKAKAQIAAVQTETFVPAFEYRETDWISPQDPNYSVANRLNANTYRSLPEAQGGNFGYNGGFAHTILLQFVKPDDFFATHPEWFAFRKNQSDITDFLSWPQNANKTSTAGRIPSQLCLTNPELLTEMIREVRELLKTGNGQPIVSITQADNQYYCECEPCAKVDAEEGSHAGSLLRFVNAIAQNIANDYPQAAIDTFAYQYTRTPPKITKPLPNVIVRLCSIECCFAHALSDPSCPNNAPFAADLKQWSRLCERLYVWDYTTNYSHYNAPFPNFDVLQPNMRFFRENHVKGVYEEGNYTATECDSEFAELRAYLLARLLWNPDTDLAADRKGFLQAYYGKGWQYIDEVLRMWQSNTGKPKWGEHQALGIYNPPNALLQLWPNEVVYIDKLWEQAIAQADTPQTAEHVRRSQLSWRYFKACNLQREFSLAKPQVRLAANQALYEDFVAFGITRLCESGARYKLGDNPDFEATPPQWGVQ